MTIKKNSLYCLLAFFLCLFSFFVENIQLQIWGMLLFILSIFIYFLRDINRHIFIFIIFITFVIFDMGVYFSHLFDTESWWENIQGSMAKYSFESSDITLSLLIMLVSFVMILIGYWFSGVCGGKNKKSLKSKDEEGILKVLRKYSKYIFYLTSVANLFYYLYKAYMVLTVSYVYLYNDFTEIWILKMCSLVWYVSFYCLLATLPTRGELKTPIYIYFFCSIASLLTGNRGITITNILFVLYYYYSRQQNEKDKWISKSTMKYVIFSIPIVLVILGIVGNIRMGNNISGNIGEYGVRLFASQGESGLLLPEVVANLDDFKYENINFTFGHFINSIQHNKFFSDLLGVHYLGGISTQTVDNAIYGNILGCAISYNKIPYTYLNGFNLGTYYLAEIWADYRWIGIVGFNLVLGFAFGKISRIKNSCFYTRFIVYGIITELFLLGRHSISYIFLFFMSSAVWVMYFLFIVLYAVLNRNRGK